MTSPMLSRRERVAAALTWHEARVRRAARLEFEERERQRMGLPAAETAAPPARPARRADAAYRRMIDLGQSPESVHHLVNEGGAEAFARAALEREAQRRGLSRRRKT
jgi:hypothetical protein